MKLEVTFDDAIAQVRDIFGVLWDNDNGTFYIDPEGYEDADGYLVVVGAREWLVDENPDFEDTSSVAYIVGKDDAAVTMEYMTAETRQRIMAMSPVTSQA